MDIANKLQFNTLIPEEMFENYDNELKTFSEIQNGLLSESLEQYKRDKQLLKSLKRQWKIKQQKLHTPLIYQQAARSSDISMNYADESLKEVIENKVKQPKIVYLDSVSKFRFESYNSYNFKTQQARHGVRRCRSMSPLHV